MSHATPPQSASAAPPGAARILLTLLGCAVAIGGAAALITLIFSTEPEPQREAATKRTPMLVDLTTVERGDFRPKIVALGTVEPADMVDLRPRVGGEIISRSRGFVPGGIVAAGEVVVELDSTDYDNALAEHNAALAQAQADLQREQGLRNVAEEEYRLLGEELGKENRALVLREPQLATARARVAAAQAMVDQATVEVERTKVAAPFAAMIISREVTSGAQVGEGDALARLVGIDEYWVTATVPAAHLPMLTFADEAGSGVAAAADDEATTVMLRHAAWPPGVHRTGTIARLIGTVDATTRMARVLITVPDPLARSPDNAGAPKLLLGTVVEATLPGRELAEVVRLPRGLVRDDNTVWTMAGGQLNVSDLTIEFMDREFAYVSAGLGDGSMVVTTSLATVRQGAPLRVADTSGPGAGTPIGAEGATR
jgi:RND family efflux transporter MFP subunit